MSSHCPNTSRQAARDEDFWRALGASIWKFHEAGVYHADMNAYNVQVDKDGDIWLLDFDKGALRAAGRLAAGNAEPFAPLIAESAETGSRAAL